MIEISLFYPDAPRCGLKPLPAAVWAGAMQTKVILLGLPFHWQSHQEKKPPKPDAFSSPLCSPPSTRGCLPWYSWSHKHPPGISLSDVAPGTASPWLPAPFLLLLHSSTAACFFCSSNTPSSFPPPGLCTCCSLHLRPPFSSCLHDWVLLHIQFWVSTTPSPKALPGHTIKSLPHVYILSYQFSSVTQSCLTLCDPMDCSTPGFPVHHQLLELAQTLVHWVGDAIQPFSPLLSPFPPAFNLSQHQGLFQWVSSSHQVVKVLEFQLQHQPFQWIFRTGFL